MDARTETLGEDPWRGHAQAIGRLAASLVRGDEAHDLVQETWLRAGSEPRSRAWLNTVLRNLARDRARSRERRVQTECKAARDERVPSSAEIVAGLELAEQLAREVAALDEPYRLALHLRYFEDLAPDEIAARCGLAPETVRTHLKRGLARLRERMDRTHGGERRAWAVALLPLVPRGPGFESTAAGTGLAAGGLAATVTTLAMSTKILSSAAVVVVVGLGVLFWRRSGEPAATLSKAATPPVLAQVFAPPVTEPTPSAREPVATTEAAAAPAASTATPASASDRRTVEGTVAIVDEEQGEELDEESGTLTIATGTSMNREDITKRDIAFEDGRFEVELGPGEWIVFGRLVARGREALLPEILPIVPGDGPLVVRGRWPKRGRLRVIDAVTRRDLTDVEVRCNTVGWRALPEWTHPGDHPGVATVVEHGVSPLDLPVQAHGTVYWVHAPGHAWASLTFDHRVGGERSIELSPAPGRVSVITAGALPENAFVRLYRREEAPNPGPNGVIVLRPPPEELPSWCASVSLRADPSGTTRVADFQGGRYLASVEVGEYEDRLRLGSADVEVPESGAATVTVPVDASLLDVPRTHLFGSIRVPEGLARDRCSLRIERLDGGEKEFSEELAHMSYHSGENDVLRWDAGPMRTGRYIASFDGIQYRELFDTLGAGSETAVDFVLPPLVTVRVEVVDRATGQPLDARVTWHGAQLPGVNHSSLSKVLRDPTSGALEFVTARGTIEVGARLEGYRDASQELELTGTTATCRLELEHATGVRIVMREGEAALPVGIQYWYGIRVTGAQGERVPSGRWSTNNAATIPLDPGRYTLEFPELDGFEPIAPRTVEVVDHELAELVIDVLRKP